MEITESTTALELNGLKPFDYIISGNVKGRINHIKKSNGDGFNVWDIEVYAENNGIYNKTYIHFIR